MYSGMFLGECFPSHDCAMVYFANCKFWTTYFVVCIQPLWGCLLLLLLVKKIGSRVSFLDPSVRRNVPTMNIPENKKCYVIFRLSSAYVNYDLTILFFSSMCIKNVLCFLQKKNCIQNVLHVYFNHIINYKQVFSHSIFIYHLPCGRIHDRSILLLCKIWPTTGLIFEKLIFILSFYVKECPVFLKKLVVT
jgi:hypothetical protein